jgi:hypothetical protein
MERACLENVAVMWLTGLNSPDHNTLWRFWQANQKAIRKLLKKSARVAAKQNLVGMVIHAVDGTKIRAQASAHTAHHRKALVKALERIDASIDEMAAELEKTANVPDFQMPEELEDQLTRKQEIGRAIRELDEAETNHYQPAEPDAQMMKCDGRVQFGYNAQVAVDEKNGFIVAADVTNAVNDTNLLAPMVSSVKENLGEPAQVTVADKGYSAGEDLAEAENRGHNVIVNLKKNVAPAKGDAPFHASRFTYDGDKDCCICPLGKELPFQRLGKPRSGDGLLRVYHCDQYRDCPQRLDCSKNKRGRTIGLTPHHWAVERQRRKQEDQGNKEKLMQRARIVEPTFAQAKHNLEFRLWSFRHLEGVRTQWALICTTINLRKLYKTWERCGFSFA